MQIAKYTRTPFDVDAVLVTFEDMEEIAEWCGGSIGKANYKVLGVNSQLDCVLVLEVGSNNTRYSNALVGHWIVKNKGHFRIYRPAAFSATYRLKAEVTQKLVEYAELDTEQTALSFAAVQFLKGDRVKIIDLDRLGTVFMDAGPMDTKIVVMLDHDSIAAHFDCDRLVKCEVQTIDRELAWSEFKVDAVVTIANTAHAQQGRIGTIVKVEWRSDRGCYVYTLDFVTGNEDGVEFRGSDFLPYVSV